MTRTKLDTEVKTHIPGIKLSALASGIRYEDRLDLVLIELPEEATLAGVFTRNAFCAAPVKIAREHLADADIRYFLINTGNANAGTGVEGEEVALRCCQWLAEAAGVRATQVLPFSTGVIGEALPADRIHAAIPELYATLTPDNWIPAATGIMTTDTHPKFRTRLLKLAGQDFRISGFAKGSGMIKPNMATMLAFVFSDIRIEVATLKRQLEDVVSQSFNRITVDGDTSTNDACMLVASGKGIVFEELQAADQGLYQAAVRELFQELAMDLIKDAEGGTKFITVNVTGGRNGQECLAVAYALAESPLVKTALFASDPNWGRILAAVGRAEVENLDVSGVSIRLGKLSLIENGELSANYSERQGKQQVDKTDIEISVELGRGSHAETVWTSDLSHDYVRINAEYRS
ncbi:MAG: bifunctional ornithine acetyltransferase/N-acetylglutamate synthase [Gammaproteobacteria bacterium]|nr:bifunctional ornithine acetyltransferase/N-acetylglutamate synthase [Gammaproteobacteria bacterium]